MERIYVTGSAGLVGSRFVELMDNKYELLTPEVNELDILKKKNLIAFWEDKKPDAVVHCAAFTDVGKAEEQRGEKKRMCWKVNVEGTANLAEMCRNYDTFMVYISTDRLNNWATR